MSYYYYYYSLNKYYTTLFISVTTMKAPTTSEEPIVIKVNPNYPFIRKKPIIPLPLGKRSIKSNQEKFYVNHHRNTRYDLYKIIDKYLIA